MRYRQRLPTIEERTYCFRLLQSIADGHEGEPDCGDVPTAKAKVIRRKMLRLALDTASRYRIYCLLSALSRP